MEPVTASTSEWGLAKVAGEIANKLNDIHKNLKDWDAKQQVAELLDKVQELKRSAYAVEDDYRDLREKLRFKSDAFEFRTPFYYEKAKPQQPLCPKCFAQNIAAPMGEPGQDCLSNRRRCLVCGQTFEVAHRPHQGHRPLPHGSAGY